MECQELNLWIHRWFGSDLHPIPMLTVLVTNTINLFGPQSCSQSKTNISSKIEYERQMCRVQQSCVASRGPVIRAGSKSLKPKICQAYGVKLYGSTVQKNELKNLANKSCAVASSGKRHPSIHVPLSKSVQTPRQIQLNDLLSPPPTPLPYASAMSSRYLGCPLPERILLPDF